MARGRRRADTDTLDAKIEQQKAAMEKGKNEIRSRERNACRADQIPQRDEEGRADGSRYKK